MSNIVSFESARKHKDVAKVQTKVAPAINFQQEIENDINKLAEKLDMTPSEAIKVAEDFYWAYPMLVEYVRSAEYRLRNKE